MHGGENTTNQVINEDSSNISKVPSLSFQVSSASLLSMKDRESISSHIESYTLNDVGTTLEGAKEMNTFQTLDETDEAYGNQSYTVKALASSKDEVFQQKDIGLKSDMKQTKDILEKEEVCLPLNLPAHDYEQSPHSIDCNGKNCHEILRSDKKIQENILRQQTSDQQLNFACNLCGDLFISNQHLTSHLSSYSESDSSLCEVYQIFSRLEITFYFIFLNDYLLFMYIPLALWAT